MMEQTESSETSAYKIQTPGNRPKEKYNIQNTQNSEAGETPKRKIQHSEHGERLKSRTS